MLQKRQKFINCGWCRDVLRAIDDSLSEMETGF
jgi:hypothetical protein